MSTTRHTCGPTTPFKVVVVVGSLGALESFKTVLTALPSDFPAALVFDLHRGESYGWLEERLRSWGALQVSSAVEGAGLEPGTVCVAPHDRQLVLTADRMLGFLGSGNGFGHRFADELLVSAASAFGTEAIAVVLSGRLDRGARGVSEVKRQGGRVLVQDPATAMAAAMPKAALATGCVDFALSPESLGHALLALCSVPGGAELFRVRLNVAVGG